VQQEDNPFESAESSTEKGSPPAEQGIIPTINMKFDFVQYEHPDKKPDLLRLS